MIETKHDTASCSTVSDFLNKMVLNSLAKAALIPKLWRLPLISITGECFEAEDYPCATIILIQRHKR